MKRIYLDTNIYNRPFDDQSEVGIRMETISIFSILQGIRKKELELLWSFILDYENSLNPNEGVRMEIDMASSVATKMVEPDETILQRAKRLESSGIKARDALHVACAVCGKADYFITCDYRLIKKAKRMRLGMEILNPIDFARKMEVD